MLVATMHLGALTTRILAGVRGGRDEALFRAREALVRAIS